MTDSNPQQRVDIDEQQPTSPDVEKNDEHPSLAMLNRRNVLKSAGVGAAGLIAGVGATSPVSAATGGPVVLMGIDAEDNNVPGGEHGGITLYQNLAGVILTQVTNTNSGILAIGAKSGKDTGRFWDAVGTGTGQAVTYAGGATAIQNANFSNYALVGVSSSLPQTPDGGLTNSENDALINRAADLAAFVNGGGGLLGFSQAGLTRPWAYLGGLGTFSTRATSYANVTATSEGNALGITDSNLDVCCWHDTFTAWPSFLNILATNNEGGDPGFGETAALGGATVVIPTCTVEDTTLLAGQDTDVGTVTVEQVAPGDPLLVTYTTTGDWYMRETHLHVAEDCADIPQTGSGNPKVGHFEFSEPHDPPVQEYTYEVPLDAAWESEDMLCIAAHADVFQDMNDNGTYESEYDREETAWGDGDRFTQRGNWAMHFDYDVC